MVRHLSQAEYRATIERAFGDGRVFTRDELQSELCKDYGKRAEYRNARAGTANAMNSVLYILVKKEFLSHERNSINYQKILPNLAKVEASDKDKGGLLEGRTTGSPRQSEQIKKVLKPQISLPCRRGTIISFTASPDLINMVNSYCNKAGINRSEFICTLLTQFVSSQECEAVEGSLATDLASNAEDSAEGSSEDLSLQVEKWLDKTISEQVKTIEKELEKASTELERLGERKASLTNSLLGFDKLKKKVLGA